MGKKYYADDYEAITGQQRDPEDQEAEPQIIAGIQTPAETKVVEPGDPAVGNE